MRRRDSIAGISAIPGHAPRHGVLSQAHAAVRQAQSGDDDRPKEWPPVLIPREQPALVEALVERIIPATDTPGARDVGRLKRGHL